MNTRNMNALVRHERLAEARHQRARAQAKLLAARVLRSIEHATRFQKVRQEVLDETIEALSMKWLNHRVRRQMDFRDVEEASRKQRLAYHQRMVEKPLLPDKGRAYHQHMVAVLSH